MKGIQDWNGRRRFGAAVFVLGLLFLVVALTPVAPATAAFPGGNGFIAFISDRNDTNNIWITEGRKDVASELPNSGQSDQPSWSPDGRYIIFQSTRDGNSELYYYDMELHKEFRLSTNSWNDESPAFSPDGREIVWESTYDGDYEIYRAVFPPYADWWLSYDWPLTNNSSNDRAPTWSPDGKRIAFDTDRDGNGEIYVMDADGSDQHNITHDPEDDWNPDWSPDGTKIAYNSRPSGDNNFEIYTINTDGSGMDRKTHEPGDAQWPAWSPDGRMIAYTNKYGGYQLKIVYVLSEDEHILEVRGHKNIQPTWQPDPPTPFTLPPVRILTIGDSITAGFPWTTTERPLGDADISGYVDSRDLNQYNLWIIGSEAKPSSDTEQFKRADTDQDNDIDETDRDNAWNMVNRIYPRAWVKKERGDSPLASYRLPLYQLLCAGREEQCPYAFVGTKLYDFTYEGYPNSDSYPQPPKDKLPSFAMGGQTTQAISAGIIGELNTLRAKGQLPDIALIHLGINDVNGGVQGTSTANLQNIVKTLRDYNRSITVFLAKIVPPAYPGPSVCKQNTFFFVCKRFESDPVNGYNGYNELLETWCDPDEDFLCQNLKDNDRPNSHVYLVDFSDFNSMDWLINSDEVHPNRHGECQMAIGWYEALADHDENLSELPGQTGVQFCAAYPDSDPSDLLPAIISDRYDVNAEQSLIVYSPGVLANDLNANGDPRAYFVGSNQHIYELAWVNDWWNLLDVTQAAIAPPLNGGAIVAATVRDVSEPRVYYISSNQHVFELAWSDQNNQWSYRDLKMDAGGPPAAVGSALSVTTVNSLPRVYYLAAHSDGLHIHEYAFAGPRWSHRDVTADTNAPPVVPGSPLSVTAITNDDPRVYFLTADRHVHELAWRSLTNVWYHRDVTVDGGGMPVAGNTLATTKVDSLARVYYLSDDQHVHEMNWGANGWSDRDITTIASAPQVVAGGMLSAITVRDIGEPRVYYPAQGQNGLHIHELAWSDQDQTWGDKDLTTQAGGPPAFNDSPVSSVAVGLLPHVYYQSADQHVYELAFGPNNEWGYTDLTKVTGGSTPVNGSPIAPTAAGGGPLMATLVDKPSHGRLTFKPDGSFIYKPDSGFTGQDSFTYRTGSGAAESAPAIVTLEVTDECAPVPGNLVDNFCFARGRAQWRFRTDGQGSFTATTENSYAGINSAVIAIDVPGNNVQLYQTGIVLQPNTLYELSFAAYSNDGRDMSIWLHKHGTESPTVNYGLKGYRFDLATYWRWYTITFTTPNLTDMDDGRLRFWFAPFDAAGTVYHIDRVLLRPVSNP